MLRINPLLQLDFYKTTHHEQYPAGMTKLVSYFTPRMSRINDEDFLIMFGLQGFIKEYLIRAFNEEFFGQPKENALSEYQRVIDNTLGKDIVNYDKISRLHDLGYLPIEIWAVPEGTKVPIKVPMYGIWNTHPDFAWLVNTLETALSCTLWHPMISANVGYRYRQIVNKFYELSVDENVPRCRAIGDFSMRGQESLESATKSSAGFLLSFVNTATVPAILYLEEYYNADCEKEPVAFGLTSTEHSVMCSSFAVDGDEITMTKRLLKEIYPHVPFNQVSDSYDYWNMVKNILPSCKKEILEHTGFLGVRGDSGDPVEISTETVFSLWNDFGGKENAKGFNVLDSHLKAVYGDSITPRRLEKIYQILIDKGFACNNVSLASGSFAMQCIEQDNQPALDALEALRKQLPKELTAEFTTVQDALKEARLSPFTRDTFGIAIKSTYGEVNGKSIFIHKDPKTDDGFFKKSQRGCCVVFKDDNGNLAYEDGYTLEEANADQRNLLTPVFRDGKMTKEYSLADIRDRLHDGMF